MGNRRKALGRRPVTVEDADADEAVVNACNNGRVYASDFPEAKLVVRKTFSFLRTAMSNAAI